MSIGVDSPTTPASDAKQEVEQKASDLENAAQAFELASAIIQWRMYCENSWCGGELETFDEPPSDYIETEANSIRLMAVSMCGELQRARRDLGFQRLDHALKEANQDFRELFHSDSRRWLIERYEEIEWEIQTKTQREFWLLKSPFTRPAYRRFLAAAWRLVSSCPMPVCLCFKLGMLAASEQYHLLSSVVASEKGIAQAVVLQLQIAPALRQLLSRLDAFEQVLALPDFDISYELWHRVNSEWGYKCWAQKRLNEMGETLPIRLRCASAQLREEAVHQHEQRVEASCLPSWRSDNHVLSYCGVQCNYKRSAPKQWKVLDAFEHCQWGHIKNPFVEPTGKPAFQVFKDTIGDLNNKKCKVNEIPIRFSIDADHQTARWQNVSQDVGGAAGGPT
jgi:hypothetical protein